MPSTGGLLADLVLVVHLAYIAFAVLGALAALAWRWAPLVHVPAVAWGVVIEVAGGTCPLTPLENSLRRAAGGPAYDNSFIEHYLTPVIYPSGLSSRGQALLGLALALINVMLYAWVIRRSRASRITGA